MAYWVVWEADGSSHIVKTRPHQVSQQPKTPYKFPILVKFSSHALAQTVAEKLNLIIIDDDWELSKLVADVDLHHQLWAETKWYPVYTSTAAFIGTDY
ncbi:hypothetical protein NM688_g7197 [Phlebia brevispora]|uniref:Uncharacterized protein n=1 Tax=Phlebia brevispora TaxID=194682 RepID=A0ACC1S838_9APHY|nr:hypothetical protein NM688_g7197 [Phlebia brevispora]